MGERGVSLWVGVIIISAVVVAVVVFGFLSRSAEKRNTYTFDVIFKDAQEVQPGSRVTLAGVTVGQVEAVEPTKRHEALLRLRIQNGTVIGDNFRIYIAGGLLISEKVVKIIPSDGPFEAIAPGATVRGYEVAQIQDIIDAASLTVVDLRTAINSVNTFLQDESLRTNAQDMVTHLNGAAENFETITDRLRRTAQRNETKIDDTLSEIKGASASLNGILTDVRGMIKESLSPEDMAAVQASLKRTSQNIEELSKTLSEELSGLISDPEMQTNIKETVANLRLASQNVVDVTEEAKGVASKVNTTLGTVQQTVTKSKDSLKRFREGLSTDFQFTGALDEDRYRADANLYIPGGAGQFYRLGAVDIGEHNGFVAQFGTHLSSELGLRFGLYDDRLGAGLDWASTSGRDRLSLDMYEPNDLHTDFRYWRRVSPDWSVGIGMDGWTKENSPVLGLSYGRAPRRSAMGE
jgi:ABC-type transporter Mla subunit MlaD